jgi:hypothetical protein
LYNVSRSAPAFSELAANRESDGHVQNAGTDLPTT